jgi:uncharacterized protein YjeT (DUF2065 family)
MGKLVLGIGLVLVVEGLAYALAPSLLERILAALQGLNLDQRRLLGLGSLAAGVALVWLSHAL